MILSEYFKSLRSGKNHLGLGDIRLTIDQQEELVEALGDPDLKSAYITWKGLGPPGDKVTWSNLSGPLDEEDDPTITD